VTGLENCAAVIPCRDEAATIAGLVAAARGFVRCVIVVDDGSRDDTATRASAAGASVVRHAHNRGKGAALRTGLQAARQAGYGWAIVLDGDGQHSPADIPTFLQKAAEPGLGLVIGNRMGQANELPWLRRQVNRWMSRRLSRRSGRCLPDSQCGFRLVNLPAWERLGLETNHFEVESEMLLAFVTAGHRVEFVPIQTIGRGPHSHIRPILDTWRWARWWFGAKKFLAAGRAKPPCRRMTSDESPTSLRPARLRRGLFKALQLAVLGVVLAFFYEWGSVRFYPRHGPAGFWHGTLHGALMPMALPALLAGRDVPIYAEANTGRAYKLGYIAGINACGFVVFGMTFSKTTRDRPR
jgi:glycosyltransferase involved in cell wall biosynthesis